MVISLAESHLFHLSIVVFNWGYLFGWESFCPHVRQFATGVLILPYQNPYSWSLCSMAGNSWQPPKPRRMALSSRSLNKLLLPSSHPTTICLNQSRSVLVTKVLTHEKQSVQKLDCFPFRHQQHPCYVEHHVCLSGQKGKKRGTKAWWRQEENIGK